jgi:hypothetical protein
VLSGWGERSLTGKKQNHKERNVICRFEKTNQNKEKLNENREISNNYVCGCAAVLF